VKFGANPNPPACSNPADMTTCGQHLTGNATFQLAPSSPTDAELTGKVAGGTFTGGPGHISLQLAIGSTDPLVIDLVRARAQATGISANGMTVILAGLVTLSNLHDQIAPAIQRAVAGIVTRDCTPPGPPPGCGCIAQSPGALLIGQLDGTVLGDPANCMISVDEILGNPVVAPLLTPDSCSMDSCTESDALSIGVKVEAVKATFPM
jgi:hypothetical protein